MARTKAAAPAPTTPTRGRGRPKRTETAAPAPAPQEETPKKRGRPAKKDITATPPPKDEVALKAKGHRGRPRKTAAVAAMRTSPRARKTTAVVADSPRVTKTKGRGRPKGTKGTSSKPVAAPRLNPAVRSKLRNRSHILDEKKRKAAASQAKNAIPARGGGAKRGRPRKSDAVPAALKSRAGVVKHRARRGHTTIEIPKKFIAQIQQHLLDLQAAEDVDQEAEAEVEAESEEGVEVAQVDGAEDMSATEEEIAAGEENPVVYMEEMEVDVEEGAQEEPEEKDTASDGAESEEIVGAMQMQIEIQETFEAEEDLEAEAHQQVQEMIQEATAELEDADLPTGVFHPQAPIAYMG